MAVNEISKDPDDESSQEAQSKALADNILDNFELPESLAKKIEQAKSDEDKGSEGEEKADEEEVAEESSDEESEQSEESTEEQAEEKEDEELIPKSTFQKRLDEMTREKKVLEARLRKLEEQGNQNSGYKDEDTVKLEKMSESELAALKRQTRVAQLKNASDETMVTKLFELEEKIDTVLKTAPTRFSQNQIQKFNDAVQSTAPEIQHFEKAQKDIFNLAKGIYDSTPELHKSVSGQASAWNLAVQHYKLLQEANVGKTKVAELTREKNTLKKKVSIGGVSKKATAEPDSDAKLFRKAKHGDSGDKMDFIRKKLGTDAIVDSFMSGRG
jgi:hypothetical protein